MQLTEQNLRAMLKQFKSGELSADNLIAALKNMSLTAVEELGFASIDHQRELRQGFPEVVYGAGKTKEQLAAILRALYERSEGNLIATRVSEEKYEYVRAELPMMSYDSTARMIYLDRDTTLERDPKRSILVVSAGTSDMPVAEEARLTAYLWGNHVKTCYDCGVAGIHRLLRHLDDIQSANVLIVVAGMEGALASVVGGLTARPVIAVPTSVGYGASFNGLAALLAMLNSCASGVAVVNIDNGFGAGVMASKINSSHPASSTPPF